MISGLSEPAKTMLSEVDKSLSGKVGMFANVYSKRSKRKVCLFYPYLKKGTRIFILFKGNGNIFRAV